MVAQTSRRVHSRHGLLPSLAAVAALCLALSAHAAYDSKSTDNDVKDSCKDFSVDTAGVLSANCNLWDSGGTVFDTRARTIDLDEKIGFDGNALKYDSSDYSGKCDSESLTFASDKLTLYATCSEKSVSIRIDDMIWNEGRNFGGHTPNLYWRSARWSD